MVVHGVIAIERGRHTGALASKVLLKTEPAAAAHSGFAVRAFGCILTIFATRFGSGTLISDAGTNMFRQSSGKRRYR